MSNILLLLVVLIFLSVVVRFSYKENSDVDKVDEQYKSQKDLLKQQVKSFLLSCKYREEGMNRKIDLLNEQIDELNELL